MAMDQAPLYNTPRPFGKNFHTIEYGLTPSNEVIPLSVTADGKIVISDQEYGTWSYYAGVSGTVVVTGRVIGIAALTVNLAATVSINGGPNIPLPKFASAEVTPKASLVSPTVVFTNTDSYFIEVVN